MVVLKQMRAVRRNRQQCSRMKALTAVEMTRDNGVGRFRAGSTYHLRMKGPQKLELFVIEHDLFSYGEVLGLDSVDHDSRGWGYGGFANIHVYGRVHIWVCTMGRNGVRAVITIS